MNILLLAPQPFFQNRGTPIAVKMLLEVLSEQGHTIRILTYPEGRKVETANCTITRIPGVPFLKNVKPGPSWKKIIYDVLMFFKARKVVSQDKFDLIHAVEESAFIARKLQKYSGVPYIYDMDSSLPQQIVEKYGFLSFLLPVLEKMEKKAVTGSIGVLAVCKSIEETAMRYDPSKLVQRLEDISLLSEGTPRQIDASKRINANGPIVMYIGNLEKYQGIDLLLDSFQIASNEVPEAQLVIIGGSQNDIQFYKNRSARLGIVQKTLFIGPRPISDLGVYLSQADLLVSPRIKGHNTPMKIYSYLDSGKPILATRLTTHTQVLDDEIAYLTEPDTLSMASGIVHLLSDESLRYQLARQARKRAQEKYTFEAFSRKLSDFYKALEKELNRA